MDLLELVAAVSSLLCVYLASRQSAASWPTGLVGIAAYLYVFWQTSLFGEFFLNLVYGFQSLYGWWHWHQAKKELEDFRVLTLKRNWIPSLIFLVLLGWIGLYYLLSPFVFDVSTVVLDSLVTSMSLMANVLLAHKYLENWLIWLVADTVLAVLLFYKGLYISGITYLILAVLAVRAYGIWVKKLKIQSI